MGSLHMTRVASQAQQFLASVHLGVRTRSGREAIVHAARRLFYSHNKQAAHALPQVDLANVFNLMSRPAFLKTTRKNFLELYPWAASCYASKPAHL